VTTPLEPDATPEIDARGLRCPLPVIELQRVARDTSAGQLLTLLSDDPAAAGDVAAWCRMRGHELVSSVAAPGGGTSYVVRVQGLPS
jgi:tRNA 2-thiouridine synthesizing protein A